MSKKKHQEETKGEESRRSRKEVLIAKKEAEQTRGIRLAVGIVAGFIGLIILVALVNELIISPNREVASVAGEKITLNAFQDRVEYERIQRIIFLENQLEAFNNDVGIVQQFAGQYLTDLASSSYVPDNPDAFGETVLNLMVDEILIAQAAAERGITVSDEELDAAIGADFGYYGGGLPTPLPEATETVVPTPSITPIPTAVITEVLPTATSFPTPTDGPTATPFPTATPVSEEAYQTKFAEFFADYQNFGVSQERYRAGIRTRLLREQLMDVLAIEQELPTEAEHASLFVIVSTDQAEVEDLGARINADGYLQVWNEIRSSPFDPETTSTLIAAELLQKTQSELTETFGEDLANAAFDLAVETPSEAITVIGQDGTEQYFIIMVNGRELLDLPESALQAQKAEALAAYLAEMRESDVEINDFWRGRVPVKPRLDTKFLAPPTATPEVAAPEATASP
ncbi:MAG: hypothetical protein CSB13_06995 [Chloroflexi bacterium]|nr:MAG: hypothetical protein CSB13_06995 [Chloroflexota bacterium]